MYSSAAEIAVISAVRISQVAVHPIDSCRTTIALFSHRWATAIAALCAVAEASGYRLALPALAIAFASLIACSRSAITTRGPRPAQVAWTHGGFSERGRLAIFLSLSVTAASVVSSGEAYRLTP
jgi:hypothetical protein